VRIYFSAIYAILLQLHAAFVHSSNDITRNPWTLTLSWQHMTYNPSKIGHNGLLLAFVIRVHQDVCACTIVSLLTIALTICAALVNTHTHTHVYIHRPTYTNTQVFIRSRAKIEHRNEVEHRNFL